MKRIGHILGFFTLKAPHLVVKRVRGLIIRVEGDADVRRKLLNVNVT